MTKSLFLLVLLVISLIFCSCHPVSKSILEKTALLHSKWDTLKFDEKVTEDTDFIVVDDRLSFHQYFLSWGVTLPIYLIATNNEDSNWTTQIFLAFNCYTIFLCLPGFMGYCPCFEPDTLPTDITFVLNPWLKFRKISFPKTIYTVSLERWRMTFCLWICEILALLPVEIYDQLKSFLGIFPSRTLIYYFFFFFSLHAFGVFSFLENFLDLYKEINKPSPIF